MNSRKPLENRKLMFLLFLSFFFHSFQTFPRNIKLQYAYLNWKETLISVSIQKGTTRECSCKVADSIHLDKNSKDNLNDSHKYRRMNVGLMTTTFLQFIVFLIRNTIWNSRPGEDIIPSILLTTSRIALDDKHLWRFRIAWQYKT